MNRPLDIARALLTVDLTREPDFSIGDLRISPSQRQIIAGGKQETIQPRVMQVLVALARANGAVLSREQLIESCWDGVVVGDDAINRCIAKIRQIRDFAGGPHFEIQTVARVGYRLNQTRPRAEAEAALKSEVQPHTGPVDLTSAAPVAPKRLSHRMLVGGFAVAAIAAVALALWLSWPSPDETTIAVAAAGDPSANLQDGLAADLARLGGTGNGLSFRSISDARSDFLLKVAARRAGHDIQADIALLGDGSPDLLWTRSIRSSADRSDLRERVANAVAQVTGCAARTSGDLRHVDRRTVRLLFSACERLDAYFFDPDDLLVQLWRRVVEADPANAAAMATLAFVEAERIPLDASETTRSRSAARLHLQRARSLGQRAGMRYAAEAAVLPLGRYRDRLTVIDRGLALDPDCPALHNLKSGALATVGDMEGSVISARRAAELEPSSAAHRQALVLALAYAGYLETAKAELESAERVWPDSFAMQEVRTNFDFRFGDPLPQIRKIDGGNVIPNVPAELQKSFVRSFLLARANPTPDNVAVVVASAIELTRHDPPAVPVQNLVAFGRVDEAYGLLRDDRAVRDLRDAGTYVLFRVNMRAFRLDRRFMPLADRLGLVAYWQSTGNWPDFCRDRDLPYDCKAEARRLRPKPV